MLDPKNSRLVVFICSAAILVISTLVLFGWFLSLPTLIKIQPYWVPMVVNTAICCWLCGFALLCTFFFRIDTAQRVSRWVSISVLILSTLALAETLFGINLFIDFPEFHRSLQPEYLHPGRMAPNTTLGLMMFSLGLWVKNGSARSIDKGNQYVLMMAAGTLVLGAMGLMGYLLSIEVLYAWADAVRMSLPTALCIVLLGIALSNLSSGLTREQTSDAEVTRIYYASALVITLICLTAGLMGFFILADRTEQLIADKLLQQAKDRMFFFNVSLSARSERAIIVSYDSRLSSPLNQLNRNQGSIEAQQALVRLSEPLRKNGFTAIAFEDLHGQVWPGLGQLRQKIEFSVPFHGNYSGELLWDSGYVLRARNPIYDINKTIVGYMLTEQSLHALDQLRTQALGFGKTSDVVICSAAGDYLHCFPSTIEKQSFKVPKFYNKQRLPMSYALDLNETGIKTTLDYRGHRVLAAFGPIADTGLGMVIKLDVAEIYAPIKQQLEKAVVLIFGLLLLGLWLIHTHLLPLIKNIDSARAQAELEKARFIAATEGGLDCFYIFDAVRNAGSEIVDFRCTFINERGSRLISRPPGEFVGKLLCEELPQHRASTHFDRFKEVIESGVPCHDEVESLSSQIHAMWIARQIVKLGDGIAITARDITEQKRIEFALRESERIQHAIIDSVSYSIIATDKYGIIISMNKAAERMLGYEADELVGKHTPELIHDQAEVVSYSEQLTKELGRMIVPGFETFVAKAVGEVSDEREWTYIRKDGSRFPVKLSVTELRDINNFTCGYLGVAYDITEQKRLEDHMRHLAMHDALTGLPNRALFRDRLAVALERAKRDKQQVAVALVDLDYFKRVNDTYGHQVGDELLKKVADSLMMNIRPSDTAARLGGDEFALILPNISHPSGSKIVLNKIYKSLEAPIVIDGHTFQTSLSIGISSYPENGEEAEILLRHADEALYAAKAAGRGHYRVYS
ncbi:uncharacterized protein NMK_2314 [Novimethylophilus kurashikiensis]|uniref:Diguanylate cyclase n=1 Tax=Novimethylophilus kurashikiensis TaxID=1825523 RepID=A0A2R5FCQ5_9PROT|nr:sensor domain-containing diguanylate cyclase [Novimethylophilus kurashikiensis]GBG14713.1 uncharacterized protein NMK_2314 [Novimethylophilus kurashikiensis]